MQEQPLKLLLCLLEHPGQMVGREELRKRVWGGDIHVDFDDGLNAAAWRLRQVLGDSADQPHFIETVPRKGYRFLATVTPVVGKPPLPPISFPVPVFRPPSGPHLQSPRRGPSARPGLWVAIAAVLGLLAGAAIWSASRPPRIRVTLSPLRNLTRDPAVDYVASALSRQVGQDLARAPELKLLALDGPPSSEGDPNRPRTGQADLHISWTLAREARGYVISVNLTNPEGMGQGQQTFLVSPEDLHGSHQQVSAFVLTEVNRTSREGAHPPAPLPSGHSEALR